jgi:TatD DNase family protein
MTLSTPIMVDTHAHLGDAVFDGDRNDMLRRARNAGVGAVIAVGETLDDARANIALARAHPMVKPAAGLYPTILDLHQADAMIAFIRRHPTDLVAIGEVGLDYWAVKEDAQKAVQRTIFKKFIGLSRETGLPLNVHSRSAGRHAMALLLENNALRVQMHAFDGKASAALPGVEAGYYFSIPPSIVRSRQKQKLVKRLPLSCLLVETDSPVLGPEPHARNEPANLLTAVRAIAAIKETSFEAVMEAVAENTRDLYGDRVAPAG